MVQSVVVSINSADVHGLHLFDFFWTVNGVDTSLDFMLGDFLDNAFLYIAMIDIDLLTVGLFCVFNDLWLKFGG